MHDTVSPDTLRLAIFFGLLFLFAVLEALQPRKIRTQPRHKRWVTNIGMVVVDSLAVRLLGPLIAMAAAGYVTANGWGLLNMTGLPVWADMIIALLMLDFAIYIQHVIFHRVPLFWRFHKVHHADRDIDVTTALRFHPIEIVISMLYKAFIIILLGPSVLAVLIFEIILNGMAMFNHANLRLPLGLDRLLRALLVTPDMHRVHHSVVAKETHSNFGFNLAIWDKLLGTYRAQPKAGHDAMIIGLPNYQTDKPSGLIWSLFLPFKR
ncbi:MAG: sterol desaturase family protein [Alphaproteobacteria bacterium]